MVDDKLTRICDEFAPICQQLLDIYSKIDQDLSNRKKLLKYIWLSHLPLYKKLFLSIPARFLVSFLKQYNLEIKNELFRGGRRRFSKLPSKWEQSTEVIGIEEMMRSLFKKYNIAIPRNDGPSVRASGLLLVSVIAKDEYRARQLLGPNDIVIDVGSNIGYYSLIASTVTNNTILAFEPESGNFECLKKNLANFGVQNVVPIKKALGKENTQTELRVCGISFGRHSLIDSDVHLSDSEVKLMDFEVSGKEMVDVTTLDEEIEKRGLERVDFIKIDSEGYELNILEGAKSVIREFKPKIVLSVYHHPSHKVRIPEIILGIRADYDYDFLGYVDYIFK